MNKLIFFLALGWGTLLAIGIIYWADKNYPVEPNSIASESNCGNGFKRLNIPCGKDYECTYFGQVFERYKADGQCVIINAPFEFVIDDGVIKIHYVQPEKKFKPTYKLLE